MDMENGAHGAPRVGSVYSPTGFRRLTPGLIRADRAAESFAGLPDGVTAHGQLLAALKAAAPRLGLTMRVVHAIDWLFKFTHPQDWERGGRPIVWPSALLEQEALGLSETQAKRLNRCLIEAGLVTMKDSPNGKRYGKRDGKGRIVEAYGFDLSPLAARYEEFVQLAEEGRAEREAMGRLRRRATIARKGILQILETARDYELSGEEWAMLERDAAAIARTIKGVDRPDEMEMGVVSLEQRQRAARSRLEMLLKNVEKTPTAFENEPHQYTYNPTPYPSQDTVIASKECSREGEGAVSNSPAPVQLKRPEKGMVHGIRPDELVRLTPKLTLYLRSSSPAWRDIVDAADWLRHDLGVSKSLWGEACLAMGRELAAVALAIVSTKEPEHFRTSPGGYFHGMVEKARAGELHLERTVWALRRTSDPEHARTSRGGGSHDREGHPAW
jgi:replication initiation protein RepC